MRVRARACALACDPRPACRAVQAHNFLLDDFCDVYIEASKPLLQSPDPRARRRSRARPRRACVRAAAHAAARAAVRDAALASLMSSMRTTLRLMHPLLPHVTEELHHRLFGESDPYRYLIASGDGCNGPTLAER